MSLNITFTDSSGSSIRTPFLIENTWVVVKITSYESSNIESPGFYISSSTWGLAVDYPADYPPETDYQDLLKYGTLSDLGVNPQGGLKVRLPQNDASILETYVTQSNGSKYSNKISIKDIAPGETIEIEIKLEIPPIGEARRFFVNINIE